MPGSAGVLRKRHLVCCTRVQGQLLPAYVAAQPSYVPTTPAAIAAQRQQTENLANFWREQMAEIEAVGTDAAEFKNHQLPLARIKKVGAPSAAASPPAGARSARWCLAAWLQVSVRVW